VIVRFSPSLPPREIGASDGGLSFTVPGSSSPIIATFVASGPTPLSFSITDGGFDDHGNTLVSSTLVDAGTVISGDLQFMWDVDVFAFDLPAGGHPFQLTGADVSGQLWLSTGYQRPLSTFDQQFVVPSAGRYYVLLSGSGPYQLVVQ
jgi:hypothetical protein